MNNLLRFPSPSLDRTVKSYRTNPYNNYVSTRDTIELMYQLVEKDMEDVRIDSIARGLGVTQLIERGNYYLAGEVVWRWVKENFRYKEEEGEQLFSPVVMLVTRVGDCDDFSMMVMSILRSGGAGKDRVKFATAITADDGKFSHVFVGLMTEVGVKLIDSSHGPYYGFPDTQFPYALW